MQMVKFGGEKGLDSSAVGSRQSVYQFSNAQYWFEREVLQYPPHEFDVEALRERKDKLLLANGEDSHHEALQYRANVELGKKIGLNVVDLPGAHLGFAGQPELFGEKFMDALKSKQG